MKRRYEKPTLSISRVTLQAVTALKPITGIVNGIGQNGIGA